MKTKKPRKLHYGLTSEQAARLIGVTIRGFFWMIENEQAPKAVSNLGRNLLWDEEAILAAKKARDKRKKEGIYVKR